MPACLAAHDVAFVAVSSRAVPADVRPTTDLLYVRFHGVGPEACLYEYSRAELEDWARRLAPHLPGRTLHAFFNTTKSTAALRDAKVLDALLTERLG